jgi:FKBP-type peptidyl-prolyl cis-trans isomerase 2
MKKNNEKKEFRINYFYVLLTVFIIVLIGVVLFALPFLNNGKNFETKNTNNTNVNYATQDNMPVADYDDNVCVYYELKVDGNLIETNFDSNKPLCFTMGKGMIKGFTEGIIGMAKGETRSFLVSPEDAYGTKNDYYDLNLALSSVMQYIKYKSQKDYAPKQVLGAKLYRANDVCIFVNYDENKNIAMLKCQNKLAGKTLKFRVKLLDLNKM